MKFLCYILFIAYSFNLLAQNKDSIIHKKVYLIHGQGSDYRLFTNLKLDEKYDTVKINLPLPKKGDNLKSYSENIAKKIDTTQSFILIGVSMGGMVCTELSDILHPEKVIIVSSAKCRNELPFRYRFMKHIQLNKIAPKLFYKIGVKIVQPIVEPDRNKQKSIFKAMLKDKDASFLKRSTNMIVNWDRKTYNKKIIHIHGNNDHTLPIKNIKANYTINHGSHMMILTKGEELSILISELLSK